MTFPALVVEFSPGTGPFDTPSWVDISDRVVRTSPVTIRTGRTDELTAHPPGEASVTLRNNDRLFDPEHTSGTYYGQLLPRTPFRIRVTHESVTYDLFYGFVEGGWRQHYDPPDWSTCTVDLVDLLAVIDGYTLPSVFTAEVMADSPVAYWPLDESQGARMRDATGTHGDGSYVDGTTGLTTAEDTAAGLPVRGLGLDGEHWGQIRDQAATVHARPACIEVVFRPNTENATQILYRSGTGNANEGNTVQYACNGDIWSISSAIRDGDADNLASIAARSTRGSGGVVHHYVLRRPAAGASEAWLDGEDATSSTATSPANGIAVAPGSIVGASDYQTGSGGTPPSPYKGFIGAVAIYDDDIGETRIAEHAEAALEPLNGLRSDEQIEWALDQVGVPAGLRNLDEGRAIMGPADTENRGALDFIRAVTATEQGALYVDHRDGGKIRFVERYNAWVNTRATTSRATFTDSRPLGAGEYPYSLGVAPDPNGIDTIINQADVSWSGGEVSATNDTSVAAYGPQRRTIQTMSPSPHTARALAQWVVLTSADPRPRVRTLPVNPGVHNDVFDAVVDLQIGDRITLERHPQGAGSQIVEDLLIEGEHHTIGPDMWETTYNVTGLVDVDLFILGTSELDGTDVLAY